jgi:hypothetical protein
VVNNLLVDVHNRFQYTYVFVLYVCCVCVCVCVCVYVCLFFFFRLIDSFRSLHIRLVRATRVANRYRHLQHRHLNYHLPPGFCPFAYHNLVFLLVRCVALDRRHQACYLRRQTWSGAIRLARRCQVIDRERFDYCGLSELLICMNCVSVCERRRASADNERGARSVARSSGVHGAQRHLVDLLLDTNL